MSGRSRRRFIAAAAISAAFAPAPATGQQTGAPRDTVLEVIGLHRWTVQMVADSVARYVPGMSLGQAACAVILRDSVGFAQAAVQTMIFPDRVWQTLSVVEPEDARWVKIRTYPASLPNRPAWAPAIAILRAHRTAMNPMQDYGFLSGRTDQFLGRAVDSAALAFRNEIRSLAQTQGDSLALWTLDHDRNRDNRVVAAFVLGHFAERETTWHALMRALRGPSDFPTSMAQLVLTGMTRMTPRPVDWAPLRNDLEDLLGGTNLFAYMGVLRTLTATGISPALGRSLIPPGAALLIGNLASQNPTRRRAVEEFLRQASGEDLGTDPAAWIAWVRRHTT